MMKITAFQLETHSKCGPGNLVPESVSTPQSATCWSISVPITMQTTRDVLSASEHLQCHIILPLMHCSTASCPQLAMWRLQSLCCVAAAALGRVQAAPRVSCLHLPDDN